MTPSRRSTAAASKNLGYHSYIRSHINLSVDEQATGSLTSGGSEMCNGCQKNINKKTIQCGFCERKYCSQLDKSAFEAISVVQSVTWYCMHYRNAVPGMSKVLIRFGTVSSLDERVRKIEQSVVASEEQIKMKLA